MYWYLRFWIQTLNFSRGILSIILFSHTEESGGPPSNIVTRISIPDICLHLYGTFSIWAVAYMNRYRIHKISVPVPSRMLPFRSLSQFLRLFDKKLSQTRSFTYWGCWRHKNLARRRGKVRRSYFINMGMVEYHNLLKHSREEWFIRI